MKVVIKSLLLLMVCCVFSCDRKPVFVPLDADSQVYFTQKIGSKYIYKDSLTGQLDTFVVSACSLTETLRDRCDDCNHIVQSGDIEMKATYRTIDYDFYFGRSRYVVLKDSNTTIACIMLDSRCQVGVPIHYGFDMVLTAVHSNLQINNRTYGAVYETNTTYFKSSSDYDNSAGTSVFYEPKYGLVKIRVVKDSVLQYVYELQEAFILR